MKLDSGTVYLLIAGILFILSLLKDPEKTKKAFINSGKVALTVFPVLLMIFVLMGFLESFISRQAIASWFGSSNNFLGIVYGELLGSFAMIEPAAVFPFAGFLKQSGAGYGAALGFVMSAMLIGITHMPLEGQLFGMKFMIVRNLVTFLLVLGIGTLFMVVI
jgi:uncharacterized membrane protein YraQ (UPF0718 family)